MYGNVNTHLEVNKEYLEWNFNSTRINFSKNQYLNPKHLILLMIQTLAYCALLLRDLFLLKTILLLYLPALCKADINTNQNKTNLLWVKLSLEFYIPKSISSNAALAPSTRIFFGEPWRASYIKYTPSRTMGLIFSAYPCKFK